MFYAQDDNPNGLGIEPVDLTMAAFVLPPVISIINQRKWLSEVKALSALLICAVYSALVTVVRHEVNWLEWRNALLQVCAGTFVSYKMFWIPSGLAAKIENATSVPPTTEDQDRALPPTTMQDLPVHGGEQSTAPVVEPDPITSAVDPNGKRGSADVTRSGDTGTEPGRNGGNGR